jgi:hypothetical protein
MFKKCTLSATQTAYELGHIYCGPWLMPRIVTLDFEKNIYPSAQSLLHISKDNPFLQMHSHAFPGVMLAEFTQQLGCLIILKMLSNNALPYLLGLEFEQRTTVKAGDQVVATTKLVHTNGVGARQIFYFDAEVKKDNKVVMNAKFKGMPIFKK